VLYEIEKTRKNRMDFHCLSQPVDINSHSGMVHYLLLKVPVFHRKKCDMVFRERCFVRAQLFFFLLASIDTDVMVPSESQKAHKDVVQS